MTDEKPHHNAGNTYAKKDPDDTATSHLHIRAKPSDKSHWVRAAKPGKLAEWVVKTLNDAADDKLGNK